MFHLLFLVFMFFWSFLFGFLVAFVGSSMVFHLPRGFYVASFAVSNHTKSSASFYAYLIRAQAS